MVLCKYKQKYSKKKWKNTSKLEEYQTPCKKKVVPTLMNPIIFNIQTEMVIMRKNWSHGITRNSYKFNSIVLKLPQMKIRTSYISSPYVYEIPYALSNVATTLLEKQIKYHYELFKKVVEPQKLWANDPMRERISE